MDGSGSSLASRHCVPCRGGTPPLKGTELKTFAGQLPDWKIIEEHHIEKRFVFPDFKTALKFVNSIGAVAEQEGHHPDLCFGWGYVTVTSYTHKIAGLAESDFILAAKVDELFAAAAGPKS
jgi:4a-hydroxytetrahydrobiopterin dehydratase